MKKPKGGTRISKPPKGDWSTTPVEGCSRKGPYPPDSSNMQHRIKENPGAVMAEARDKLSKVQAGYRRELYAVLGMIVGIARHYYSDYEAWKTFFNQSFFQSGKLKPKARTHQKNALRHVMNFVFDAKTKQARSRTGKYAAALHQIMIFGVPVHLVAEEIVQEGGIEKLYEAYLEREARKPKKNRNQPRSERQFADMMKNFNLDGGNANPRQDMTLGDLENDGEQTADFEDDGIEGSKSDSETHDSLDIYQDADHWQDIAATRGRDPEGRPTVELEVTDQRQVRFLDLQEGKRFVIEGHCRGRTAGKWQRLKIDKVIWKSHRR